MKNRFRKCSESVSKVNSSVGTVLYSDNPVGHYTTTLRDSIRSARALLK